MSDRTIDDATALEIAGRLTAGGANVVPIGPLTTDRPDLTAADAYAIQERVAAPRLAAGETIVGWKLGLTSRAMQQQLGVDQPDYGPILSGSSTASGATMESSRLIAPRVEAEVAVILGSPLRGPGVTREDAVAATRGLAAAIEVIDSRIADWKIRLADTIADMASTACCVVSGDVVPIDGFDPRLVGCVLELDDAVVATGAGAAAMGDPMVAVAWAANTLGGLGVTLEAGAVIMTGGLHASVPAPSGASFRATFDRLGAVSVRFS